MGVREGLEEQMMARLKFPRKPVARQEKKSKAEMAPQKWTGLSPFPSHNSYHRVCILYPYAKGDSSYAAV